MVDKNEWINKLQKVIQARGGQVGGASMRQSLSEGSLVSDTRKLFRLFSEFSYPFPLDHDDKVFIVNLIYGLKLMSLRVIPFPLSTTWWW